MGIEANVGEYYFCLPKGFQDHINYLDTFYNKKRLFFLFYKVFERFREILEIKGESSRIRNQTQDRDGVIDDDSDGAIQANEENSFVFYSKLNSFDSILQVYDEPKILSLAYRLSRTHDIDTSQIHKYLHQAVYLANDTAYVDTMLLPSRCVKYEAADIVKMYCYIYSELQLELQGDISIEITALAENFRENHLSGSTSLFEEKACNQIVNQLKDILEEIHHHTPFKDPDYWDFYEAIENFLYGKFDSSQDGKIWGINNFHSVWESICLDYISRNISSEEILYIDTGYIDFLQTDSTFGRNVFSVNGRSLRPDVVIGKFSCVEQPEQIITLHGDNWNDFGYRTLFGIDEEEDRNIRVAFIGQTTSEDTYQELQKYYDSNSGEIYINNKLPSKFISFYEPPEDLSFDSLNQMNVLNHIFMIGIDKKIFDLELFEKYIFNAFNLNGRSGYDANNVIGASLFRGRSITRIKELFDDFINQYLELTEGIFNRILIHDIKYLSKQYLMDKKNKKIIKKRSIRKQFVYEYLIQQQSPELNTLNNNVDISSSFWIPDFRPFDRNMFSVENSFLGGYIELIKVNFVQIAEYYSSFQALLTYPIASPVSGPSPLQQEEGVSALELTGDLVGSVEGVEDLATNQDYFEGFGQ
ncbi:hypothetical protein [Picosynechococcus sp. PCC 7002]|uniref:hypothetical protein n=1 Tax=Picosynechococcus sp. (strain ATCC 27264 / PCC 7002 / PR-6) TaxID=32049 RepID=UPI0030D77B69